MKKCLRIRFTMVMLGLFVTSAFLLTGCDVGKVKEIGDVDIIKEGDSIEKIAIDSGLEDLDTDLIDFEEPLNGDSMEKAASELGVKEVDSDLVEFGELI